MALNAHIHADSHVPDDSGEFAKKISVWFPAFSTENSHVAPKESGRCFLSPVLQPISAAPDVGMRISLPLKREQKGSDVQEFWEIMSTAWRPSSCLPHACQRILRLAPDRYGTGGTPNEPARFRNGRIHFDRKQKRIYPCEP